jgi:hypothetical protein
VFPLATGIAGIDDYSGEAFAEAFRQSMWFAAGLCVLGAAVAWRTISEASPSPADPHPAPTHGCSQRRRSVPAMR